MQNDKKFANLLEKIGKVETTNLDMRLELMDKFNSKIKYLEERQNMQKHDLTNYTDQRILQLEYTPEKQRLME